MFKTPFSMLINGKQGSGKSYFLKWLMRDNYYSDKPWDYGVVFSNTLFDGSFDYIPKDYQYEEFNETVLKNLMEIQKNNHKKGINKHAFVIFDDCLFDADQFTNPTIKKLCTQLRHYNISVIIATQYCHLVPPFVRGNAMYSLFFNVGEGVRELQAIFDAYGQRFRDYKQFKDVYYKYTKNHHFIMYDKESGEYKAYVAPEHIPQFKIEFNNKI